MPLNDIDSLTRLEGGTDGNVIGNTNDRLNVHTQPSHVDSTNSTATPLSGDAVFTGSWADVLNHTNVSIMVVSDKDSATNGLVFQQSSDGVNIDDTDSYTISANVPKQFTFGVAARYIRVVYTNGSVAQTTFRLQTIHHPFAPKPSSHRLDDTPISQDDAELVKAVLTGKSSAGSNYVNVKATPSGALVTSVGESAPSLPITGSGSLTALNSEVVFDNSQGYSAVSYVLTGTWVGTVTPAVSVDGINYLSWDAADRTTIYSNHTANGTFTAHIGNFRYFRLRMTAYTSGTASVSYFVTGNTSQNSRIIVNTQSSSSSGNTSRAQVATIETEHDKIHLGLMFAWTYQGSYNVNAVMRIAFTTGAQTEHAVFQLFNEYQAQFQIYEGSTTTKGASITDVNRSRTSANTSLATIQLVTAVTTSGTSIFGPISFGGTGGQASAVSFPRGQEFVFKSSTEYMIEFTSLQNNNVLSIMMDHYRNQA